MSARLKVMRSNSVGFKITQGVQGLPCLHMPSQDKPSQGKPCTPVHYF